MTWLEAVHGVAATAWVGGLTALAIRDRRRPDRRSDRQGGDARPDALYRRLVAPLAFVALLSGIWLLHDTPRLLRSPIVLAKLAATAALFVVDAACQRGFGRRTPLVAAAAATLGVAIGALSVLTPEATA